MLAPYIEAHDRGPLFDLTLRSLAMYDDFVARAAKDQRSTSNTGAAARSRSPLTTRRQTPSPRRCGQRDGALQWLAREARDGSSPRFRDSIRGALFAPSHGYVAVSSLTEALVWAALRHGAELETGATRPNPFTPGGHGLT